MCNDKKCAEKPCKVKKCGTISCMLAGLVSGITLGVIGKILLDSNKKQLMKKVNKMADAMENLTDSAMDMFK